MSQLKLIFFFYINAEALKTLLWVGIKMCKHEGKEMLAFCPRFPATDLSSPPLPEDRVDLLASTPPWTAQHPTHSSEHQDTWDLLLQLHLSLGRTCCTIKASFQLDLLLSFRHDWPQFTWVLNASLKFIIIVLKQIGFSYLNMSLWPQERVWFMWNCTILTQACQN